MLRLERVAAFIRSRLFFSPHQFFTLRMRKGGAVFLLRNTVYPPPRPPPPPPQFPSFYHSGRGGALTVLYGTCTLRGPRESLGTRLSVKVIGIFLSPDAFERAHVKQVAAGLEARSRECLRVSHSIALSH